MRILVACLLAVIAGGAMAPSSMELRNRYGAPNQETFSARPGIDVTVEYGPDRLICDASVSAHRTLFDQDPLVKPVSVQTASEILEEVAPTAIRGKQIVGEASFRSSCAAVAVTEYENVSISRTLNPCGAGASRNEELGASVSFKGEICPKHSWPSIKK